MNIQAQIRNWLMMAFEQSVGNITERFYYDRRDNQFFAIMAFDYFMLNEDMTRSSNVTTNYTKAQENYLITKTKRIEDNDPTIISIPRVGLEDRKNFMQQFINTLSNEKLIEILNQRVKNQDYRTKFDFNFGNEADELTRQKWEAVKSSFLKQQVDTFLNLGSINIDKATFGIVNIEGSISIDLIKEEKSEPLPVLDELDIKKPLWKFW